MAKVKRLFLVDVKRWKGPYADVDYIVEKTVNMTEPQVHERLTEAELTTYWHNCNVTIRAALYSDHNSGLMI